MHQLIKKYLTEGENEKLDFKQTINSASKIAKTISAFANHRGGIILVGVRDNRTVSGIESEDEKYMMDLAASFYCKPEVKLTIREMDIEGKTVLEVWVPESKEKPIYAKGEDGKWWVYVRVKDKCLLASKITVDVMRRQNHPSGTMIKFSKHEENILNYLKTNERITLKQACKMFNLSRWRTSKIFVNLISVGTIRSHTHEKEEYFTLV